MPPSVRLVMNIVMFHVFGGHFCSHIGFRNSVCNWDISYLFLVWKDLQFDHKSTFRSELIIVTFAAAILNISSSTRVPDYMSRIMNK